MRRLTFPSMRLYQGALAAVAGLLLWAGISLWRDSRHAKTATCMDVTLVVSDSTEAQCAKITSDRHELLALKDAAKHMHGDLVAGTKIIVKRDTVTRVDTQVVTVTRPDGTRLATLTDTTDDYRVTVRAEAPPSGALTLGYEVITPERRIEVGFVKRPDGYYAVASGKGVRTAESFFQPEKERPVHVVAGASVAGAPAASVVGVDLDVDAYGAVEYERGKTRYQVRVGDNGSPYVKLAVERRLW